MKKVSLLILFMLGCILSESKAQKVALKSNLLYDATATMNLGLELGLARKWTLDIPVNYNPWKPSDGKRLRHWGNTTRSSLLVLRTLPPYVYRNTRALCGFQCGRVA